MQATASYEHLKAASRKYQQKTLFAAGERCCMREMRLNQASPAACNKRTLVASQFRNLAQNCKREAHSWMMDHGST